MNDTAGFLVNHFIPIVYDIKNFFYGVSHDQVLFRYTDAMGTTSAEANINGSVDHIAGITNQQKNVLGMMPHPERAMEGLLGSEDGKLLFESILTSLAPA